MTEPTYTGMFPWMGQWWVDHIGTPPAVVVRCGYRDPNSRERECRNAIGEVKTDGERVLAMSKNEYPEAETHWQPDPDTEGLSDAIAAELADAIAERDAHLLRRYSDGRTVNKRQAWPPDVAEVEHLTNYVCRVHGEVEIDRDKLATFVSDTVAAKRIKRTFWAHRVR